MKRNLVTAVASVAGSRVAIMLASFIITPLIVHLLSPSAYGRYATLMAVFGLLMILTSSGVNTGVRKYIAEERDAEGWRDQVFGFYFRAALILGFGAGALLALTAWSGIVSMTLGEVFVGYFYLLAALTVLAQVRSYVRRTLMGLHVEHIAEPLQVGHRIAFGIVAVGLAALGYGVVGLLVGHLVADLIIIVVTIILLSKRLSLSSVLRPTGTSFPRRELIDFGGITVLVILCLRSFYHVDVLVLEAFTPGSEQVGYYRAALVLTQILWLVPQALQAVMVQSTANLWREGQVERIEAIASRTTRYSLLLTALLALGLGVLAADFLPIYFGPEYAASVTPMLLLLPGTLGFALARPIFAINHAKGALSWMVVTTGASALLNVGLNLALIPPYGIVGAAVASTLGYLSLPITHVWLARRLGYRPLSDVRLLRVGATAGVTAAVLVPLTILIPNSVAALFIVPPIGLVVFVTVALITDAVSLEELFDAGTALPSPIDRKVQALRQLVDSTDGLWSLVP